MFISTFRRNLAKKLTLNSFANPTSMQRHLWTMSKSTLHSNKTLSNVAKRGIYMKDKEEYKPNEKEYRRTFIMAQLENPEMEEGERSKLVNELKEIEQELAAQKKEEEQIFDVNNIRNMFSSLLEMQSNPESPKAKELERQMEELERKNPNKRKTQVFIKTMKGGRVVSNEKRTLGGGQIFGAEKLAEQAYNYLQHSFPEEQFLDEFPLHTYRYPTQGKPDAIVYFFHDQSKYMGKYAHVAEFLAGKGIEVLGFDLPGHGKSQGTPRGYFGTFDEVKRHSWAFVKSTVDKFGYQGVPKFFIGVSTGALTALNLALEDERFFKGINIICPLLRNDGAKPKGNAYIDFLGKAFPKLGVMKVDAQAAQPFEDPLLFRGKLKSGLFKEIDETSFYIQNNAHNIKSPLLVAHGGVDSICQPKTVRDYFENVETQDKDIILYDDCGHDIYSDPDYYPMLVQEQAMWIRSHL